MNLFRDNRGSLNPQQGGYRRLLDHRTPHELAKYCGFLALTHTKPKTAFLPASVTGELHAGERRDVDGSAGPAAKQVRNTQRLTSTYYGLTHVTNNCTAPIIPCSSNDLTLYDLPLIVTL